MRQAAITFILFTYNEEKRIAYAVRNFIKYGPVIIMDGGSQDKTQAIAEELGATFYSRPPSNNPAVETPTVLNFIKEKINTDWIYWGYCDNTAPKALVEKMCQVAEENKYKKVNLPMLTYLWGETAHPAQYSHLAALFHKDYLDFTANPIHKFGNFLGKEKEILTLNSTSTLSLRHFSTYNESKYVAGYMRYGEEEARQKFERGEKFSVIKLFAAMLRYMWIYRRSLKSPRLGILIMLNMAFGRLMTYTRLYEYENDITLDTIEDSYSRAKEKMLTDF